MAVWEVDERRPYDILPAFFWLTVIGFTSAAVMFYRGGIFGGAAR